MPLLQKVIDSRHFQELRVFKAKYTWDVQGWHQLGVLASFIARALGSRDAKPEHFMPVAHDEKPDTGDLEQTFDAFARRHNKRLNPDGDGR